MGFQNTNPIIAKEIQRKGGRVRVKKGFAKNPRLAVEAGRKGGIAKRDRSESRAKQGKENTSGSDSINLADILGDIR